MSDSFAILQSTFPYTSQFLLGLFMVGLIEEHGICTESWKLMQLFGEIISAKIIRHKAGLYEK